MKNGGQKGKLRRHEYTEYSQSAFILPFLQGF
jgi:hypothetical protein